MKNLIIISLLLAQAWPAVAQDCYGTDSIIREIQFPLTEQDTKTVFYYFNNEWLAVDIDSVKTDSIQSFEVKNDEYGNRAAFFTVSPEYLAQLKAETSRLFPYLEPRCEFPGGNGKLKEWIDANIRIPEGFKGSEKIFVQFYVQPDGTVTEPKIIRNASKNEKVNAEALRLVSSFPKFRVQYRQPKKCRLTYSVRITFQEPGAVYIRGGESDFIEQFPTIESKIRQLYANDVFHTVKDPNFRLSEICTAGFLNRLKRANSYDSADYATWLLRSGMQDGDNSESKVMSVVPGSGNTVTVYWSDMGHEGSTIFTMVDADGVWKIDNATVPEGYNSL